MKEETSVIEAVADRLNCPACGGSRFRSIGIQAFGNQGFEWLVCRACHSSVASPHPNAATLRQFYSDHYSVAGAIIPEVVQRSLQTTVQSFEPYRSSVGTLLDVGFGEGTLLAVAQANDWKCSGSEYAKPSIEWGRKRGIDVHEGDLANEALPGPFDVVTLVETIEHVLDPSHLLESIHGRLRPGGLLYGTTPNMAGISARLLKTDWSVVAAPEHLTLFSPRGMRAILRDTGFTNVNVETRGLNIGEIRSHLKPGKVVDFDRVQSGYALNTALDSRVSGRATKKMANRLLRRFGGGDTIVFRAVRN